MSVTATVYWVPRYESTYVGHKPRKDQKYYTISRNLCLTNRAKHELSTKKRQRTKKKRRKTSLFWVFDLEKKQRRNTGTRKDFRELGSNSHTPTTTLDVDSKNVGNTEGELPAS